MQKIFPTYKRFYIKGKDDEGNLIFACKLVTEDGLCSDYRHRPRMCRKYPAKKINYQGKLHEGCGYKVEVKKFENYLK
jgi:Fe-S-cluster containining protein